MGSGGLLTDETEQLLFLQRLKYHLTDDLPKKRKKESKSDVAYNINCALGTVCDESSVYKKTCRQC